MRAQRQKNTGEKGKEFKKQKWKKIAKPPSANGAVAREVLLDSAEAKVKTARKRRLTTIDADKHSKANTKRKGVMKTGKSKSSSKSTDGIEREAGKTKVLKKKRKKKGEAPTAVSTNAVKKISKKTKKKKDEVPAVGSTNAVPDALSKVKRSKILKVKKKSKVVSSDKGSKGAAPKKTKTVKAKGKKKPVPVPRWQLRQRARVVCPGSVSERYARGLTTSTCLHIPLTGEERALLNEGDLSWRWLRQADAPAEQTAVEADPFEHGQLLDNHASELSGSSLTKLYFFDECLERDALLPPCALRASLAVKLASRGAIYRRCTRQLEEVILPLIAPGPGPGNGLDGDDAVNGLRDEARALCERCAQDWMSQQSAPPSGADASARTAWLKILCLSMQPEGQAQIPEGWQPLLHGLRLAFLARFFPKPEKEGHPAMLRAVAAASAPKHVAASQKMLVLPFGLFTGQQTLLLMAIARWFGGDVMVIRRSASGTPDVIFRSAGVSGSE